MFQGKTIHSKNIKYFHEFVEDRQEDIFKFEEYLQFYNKAFPDK